MIINKQDEPAWYRSIREEKPRQMSDYYAENIKTNEVRCGDATLAKIPDIKGFISRKHIEGKYGTTTYIELITERTYDPEKHQTRNKRVTIGQDVDHLFHGMMIINDNYHNYFDRDGNLLISLPTEPGKPAKATKNPAASTEITKTETTQHKDYETKANQTELFQAETNPIPTESIAKIATDQMISKPQKPQTTLPKTLSKPPRIAQQKIPKQLLKAMTEMMEKNGGIKSSTKPHLKRIAKETPEMQNDPNETSIDSETQQEIDEELEKQKKQYRSDRLEFWDSLLNKYKDTIDEQARKKPDKHLTLYQTQKINDLLKTLQTFFHGSAAHRYLELAKEPTEEDPNSGVTYGDMAILLSSYAVTMYAYKYNRMWVEDPFPDK